MAFYPHLVYAVEVVILRVVIVYQLHDFEVITLCRSCIYLDTISQLVIEPIVYVYYVLSAKVPAVVVHYIIYDALIHLRIDTHQCLSEHLWQDAFLYTATTSSTHFVLFFYAGIALYALPSVFGLR